MSPAASRGLHAGVTDPSSAGGGDPYASAILADRPRHYYRLDEPEADRARELPPAHPGRPLQLVRGEGLRLTSNKMNGKVGLLWLGEEYAQLEANFCEWQRSGGAEECAPEDLNRSAFVAWIDCQL